jgi:hypothetical protein
MTFSACNNVIDGSLAPIVKTGKWGGVVATTILMSDVKDEIDWVRATNPGCSIAFAHPCLGIPWCGNL